LIYTTLSSRAVDGRFSARRMSGRQLASEVYLLECSLLTLGPWWFCSFVCSCLSPRTLQV
jgi:hypothetical protein